MRIRRLLSRGDIVYDGANARVEVVGMPVEASAAGRLYLFGRFRLLAGADDDVAPKSSKARALLACLALSREGRAGRADVAGLLWSSSDDPKSSLRQCVRELRAKLGGSVSLFDATDREVVLGLSRLWVDALEAQRLARSAAAGDADRLATLVQGDLLGDVDVKDPAFESWLVVERTRQHYIIARALLGPLERCLEQAEVDRAERLARALLRLEPANEAAHRALMRCHAIRGDMAGGVRQYEACRQLLARRMDVTPSSATQALLQQLRKTPTPSSTSTAWSKAPVIIAPEPRHVSILVEDRTAAGDHPVDAAVGVALAASLRAALARKRWLAVVDRGASADRAQSDGRAGEHPQYFVSTKLLRGGDRVRFAAELTEARTSRVLWAEHFDRTLEEQLFDAADLLTDLLARRLDGEIERVELMRASRQPVEALSAYDCVLRAIPLMFKTTGDAFAASGRLLRQAEEADPFDSHVYAWRAMWLSLQGDQGFTKDMSSARQELSFVVQRAIELDPANALALAIAGHIASFVEHDYARGLELFDEAMKMDPSSLYASDLYSMTLCYTGRAREAAKLIEGSRKTWERHQQRFYFRTSACIALMIDGSYEDAIDIGRRVINENPNFQAAYRPLIASLGHLGHRREAAAALSSLHRLEPAFSIEWFRAHYPPLQADQTDRYIDDLRRAGVPES